MSYLKRAAFVVLLVVLASALPHRALGQADQVESSVNTKKPTAKVAIVHSRSPVSAARFKTLLEENAYAVTLVNSSQVADKDLGEFDLILVDTSVGKSQATTIDKAGKPILAMGEGGYRFFGDLELPIGAPYGWHGRQTSLRPVDPDNTGFWKPFAKSLAEEQALQIYTTSRQVGINIDQAEDGVVRLGRELASTRHYILIGYKQRYLFWGFQADPRALTETGKALFLHTCEYALGHVDKTKSRQMPKTEEPPSEPVINIYAVPEGNVNELLTFIDKVKGRRPRTREELVAHREKAPQALGEAAKRILALEKDESSKAFGKATAVLLELRVSELLRLNEQQQQALLSDVLTFTSKYGTANENARLVYSLARQLEYANRRSLAAKAYTSAGEIMAKSDDEALVKRANKYLGAARRMQLLGNDIQLQGTLVDGSDFNWQDYRGKVVLVDFWATWCGPCIAELPNVLKHYELYHDRGFEVVGISLDTDRKRLETFLVEKETPWAPHRDPLN